VARRLLIPATMTRTFMKEVLAHASVVLFSTVLLALLIAAP
jgi:hypothetical protein